jgi:8-oxo-dGTP pyrophosphatase MutT (NUDIX family)
VLSTLHTNDAPSAVTRLIDIGVASYKIATAVKGVLAQRLVRRVCTACAGTPRGCPVCGGSGFHGRLALVEVLIGSPEFERRVAAGEPTERIAEAARGDGMRSLWRSGLIHSAEGRTTVEEVLRVATPDDEPRVVSEPARVVAPRPRGDLPEGTTLRLLEDLDDHLARFATRRRSFPDMTQTEVGTIDVVVVRPLATGWRVLALQRTSNTRCPQAWEIVHGHIEPGEEPADAAIRELHEEAGLAVARLYNLRVQPFYLHKLRLIQLAIVFVAFVDEPANVVTSGEHDRAEWLSVDEALARFGFPSERASLREAVELLAGGDAGAVDDVMRVL